MSFKPVFPWLLKFPFMAGSAYDLPMTKDEMIRYLKFPYIYQTTVRFFFGHIEAVLWVNRLIGGRLLESWVDCALH